MFGAIADPNTIGRPPPHNLADLPVPLCRVGSKNIFCKTSSDSANKTYRYRWGDFAFDNLLGSTDNPSTFIYPWYMFSLLHPRPLVINNDRSLTVVKRWRNFFSMPTHTQIASVADSCGYDTWFAVRLVMDYTALHFTWSILGLYSEIDHIHLSSEAQCVSHHLPLVDCHSQLIRDSSRQAQSARS